MTPTPHAPIKMVTAWLTATFCLQALAATPPKAPISSAKASAAVTSAPTPSALGLRHGDTVTITGNYGNNDVATTFLGGASGPIERLAAGTKMPNGEGWTFNDIGATTTVKLDPVRGKVLYSAEDSQHYNATRRYDVGFGIPERRCFYKAHQVRNVMLLDGAPYTKSYQWKHERINFENSISDGPMSIKVHNWQKYEVVTYLNRSATDASTYWGGKAADHNSDWALLEILACTGTQGGADGKLITRVHKNGHTLISQNRQNERIYVEPTRRLRYFLEQNYFGNFGQLEDGVDNTKPHPQVREVYSDDSRVIVGRSDQQGWKRVELRDAIDLQSAKIRELQSWANWKDGTIQVKLNAGGLSKGLHLLYLVVIDGVDANGWDRVIGAAPIKVQVD